MIPTILIATLMAVPGWQGTVRRDGCDIVATGTCTTFGTRLLGARCSTGVRLRKDTIGCALPRGRCKATRPSLFRGVPDYTLVRIYWQKTNKSTVVPIIDSGPAIWTGNMIDVTPPVKRRLKCPIKHNPRLRIRILSGTAEAGKALTEVQ